MYLEDPGARTTPSHGNSVCTRDRDREATYVTHHACVTLRHDSLRSGVCNSLTGAVARTRLWFRDYEEFLREVNECDEDGLRKMTRDAMCLEVVSGVPHTPQTTTTLPLRLGTVELVPLAWCGMGACMHA